MLSSNLHSTDVQYCIASVLFKWIEQFPEAFNDNFNLPLFVQRYASNNSDDGNPFLNSSDFSPDNFEWQYLLEVPSQREPVRLLCCPEDVERCPSCKKRPNVLCGDCRIPLCKRCWSLGWSSRYNHRIPMALANDNFIGYATELLAKYKVRWLEAAIVSPCWTSMIIYYVEGDHGHLLNEDMGQQKCRTVVRGSCASYWMPWEDILESLKRNCSDRNLEEIPLPQECLKYMLRVHLQVRGVDLKKHLKQTMVRPFVLVALLDYLIAQNHEVFRGKGSAQELRARMREAVAREHPEMEPDKAPEARQGTIPKDILDFINKSMGEKEDVAKDLMPAHKRRRFITEKNATPGDGARSLETCLEDIRPHAVCMDRSTAACSDPAAQREGALERYGDLHIQTGGKEILQFHTKYFSQVLPFVFPQMASGPDYFPEKRHR